MDRETTDTRSVVSCVRPVWPVVDAPPNLSGAALGMAVGPGCAEDSLALLTAALGELRAAVADPTQHEGEGGHGWGIGAGHPLVVVVLREWLVLRPFIVWQ